MRIGRVLALLTILAVPQLAYAQLADHLLISEVNYDPVDENGEFVEIFNPTNASIPLNNGVASYFLSDEATNKYWQIVNGNLTDAASDWIVQFPVGAAIPARGFVVVTGDSDAFACNYYPFRFEHGAITDAGPGDGVLGSSTATPNLIRGAASGATATIAASNAGWIAVCRVSGAFVNGETVYETTDGTSAGDTGDSAVISLANAGPGLQAFFDQPSAPALFEFTQDADNIPNLVKRGSANAVFSLTNTSESVVLFRWDGTSDLVQDVDHVKWGTGNNLVINKSAVTIDGPDPDTNATAYLTDAGTATAAPDVPSGYSIQRLSAIESGESLSAGNGITGHDESTEDWATGFSGTGASAATPTPGRFLLRHDGDLADLASVAAPRAVSAADGSAGSANPADFGGDGTISELYAYTADENADGIADTLWIGVRGELFASSGAMNATFVAIDVAPGSAAGTIRLQTNGTDLTDIAGILDNDITEANFVLGPTLVTNGIAFDAIAGTTDQACGSGDVCGLRGLGSDGVSGATSDFHWFNTYQVVVVGTNHVALPAAAGATFAGPDGVELKIALADLGNPPSVALAAFTSADGVGGASPNTLPENASNTFDVTQTLEAVAFVPITVQGCLSDVDCGACQTCSNFVCLQVADGTSCEDGSLCTTNDVCNAGACDGTPVVCSGACDLGTCDPATGLCELALDGTSCDDGSACTTDEVCLAGTCGSGSVVTCNGPCDSGVCLPTSGCEPMADGTSCDDSDLCTNTTTCSAGVCGGGTAVVCNGACDLGTCSAATGCDVVTDGTACDDGNACTSATTCTTGLCGAGSPVVCAGPCFRGTCDPTSGCDLEVDGSACDDGDLCTSATTCTAGTCGGGSSVTCLGACDTGTCNPFTGVCDVVADGTACSDGDACTSGDTCTTGVCGAGSAVVCDGPCHTGTCNAATGCEPLSDGTTCEDGDLCTNATTCSAGVCGGGTAVTCSGACDTGTCNPTTGTCDVLADGTACSDGDACTSGETCSSGACGSGSAVVCDGPCLVGTCTATSGCDLVAEGTSCEDGDLCTSATQCASGVCSGGTATSCTGACETGTCNAATGLCDLVVDGTTCSDGNACTTGETCTSGACGSAQPVDCTQLDDACNVGTCNATTGQCEAAPVTDGTSCDDANACTTGEACTAGVCGGGTAPDCSNLNDACNVGTCNATTGQCEATPVTTGTACDDGDLCTTGESCDAGVCTGATAVDCSNLDDACHVGTCNATTGQCEAVAADDGTTCDDTNPCTENDACAAGACVGTALPSGTACGDQCNTGTCDDTTGQCVTSPVTDGTACDDGNTCTDGDACAMGVCGGTVMTDGASCEDGNPCTETDVCTAGVCAGTTIDCSAVDDACNVGVCDTDTGDCTAIPEVDGTECNDDDVCTADDVCTSGACAGTAVEDGTACDDGDDCTTGEACTGGVCEGGTNTCEDVADPGADVAEAGEDTTQDALGDVAELIEPVPTIKGGGCDCRVQSRGGRGAWLGLLAIVGLALLLRRRRAR